MGAHKLYNDFPVSDEIIQCPAGGYAVAFSRGIRNLKNISAFLGVDEVISPARALRERLDVTCVVVWGRKENSHQALRYAARNQLEVLFVEDGWIRSCSANAHSRTSYSILVDNLGVYYDSTQPSALERFLNRSDKAFDADCGPLQLRHAQACRKRIVENNITKYNFCKLPEPSVVKRDNRPLVLVIDQTVDDASVRYGGMDHASFVQMLDTAIDENPDCRIVVRTHPDVASGIRQGYLQSRAAELDIELSAAGDNPLPWLKHASAVYVGTSQLGYEALMCGCKVTVAGKPFYAGWGLTNDIQLIERRAQVRSLDQMFYATHIVHARYCCPVTGQRWTLDDCLDHVILQLSYFQRNALHYVCIGITPWKKRYLTQFLRSPYGAVRFSQHNNANDSEQPLFWSFASESDASETGQSLLVRQSGVAHSADNRTRVEDGFIRSQGLGSDFTPPASLVFDEVGLYFDAGGPSKLENLLNEYNCTEAELERARELRRLVLSSSLTKYNLGTGTTETPFFVASMENTIKILVIGQVEGDQSILRGSSGVRSNSALIEAVRASNPHAHIVYRPHPDVVSGNRSGTVDLEILKKCVNHVESSRSFLECLDECDELHTITSLSGFEAILRDKAVVTYGLPFYAGWGLTRDIVECGRRLRIRTVDELVFLSLVVYPHYVDLKSGEFASVEQLVELMSVKRAQGKYSPDGSWIRKINNIYSALVYRS